MPTLHTDVSLHEMVLRSPSDDTTHLRFRSLEDPNVSEKFKENPTLVIQRGIPLSMKRFVIIKALGSGHYGTALLCEYVNPASTSQSLHQTKFVLKLGNNVINHDAIMPTLPLDSILINPRKHNNKAMKAVFKRTRNRFLEEFRNAELILEPPLLRSIRHERYTKHQKRDDFTDAYTGKPAHNWSYSDYFKVLKEMHIFRAHPGYAHLHKLQHFDLSIPALISEPAFGNLRLILQHKPELLKLYETSNRAPKLWVRIAWQVGNAVRFLDEMTPLAHLDIKTDNILMNFADPSKPSTICCLLSDYGLCEPKNAYYPKDWSLGEARNGLWPSVEVWADLVRDMNAPKVQMRALSFYLYFSTLLALITYDTEMSKSVTLFSDNTVPNDEFSSSVADRLFYSKLGDPDYNEDNKVLKSCFERAETASNSLSALAAVRRVMEEKDPTRYPDHFYSFLMDIIRPVMGKLSDPCNFLQEQEVSTHVEAAKRAALDSIDTRIKKRKSEMQEMVRRANSALV